MTRSVKLIECPRDAWQGLAHLIPTERKAEYLRALVEAGFRHLDAVSFVSPKAVPQMADSEEVLKLLGRPAGVEVIGIVVNEKGAERAISTGAVSTLGYPFSISGTFLQRNQKQTRAESEKMLERIRHLAADAGLQTVAYISMAFGNPYGDPWDEGAVADAVRLLASFGVEAISLADTVGAAGEDLIRRVVERALPECGNSELGVHLHSRAGEARSRILAAYDAGCRRFDSALGGLGGCPFAQDSMVGNIPTEELLGALRDRNAVPDPEPDLGPAITLNREIAGVA